MPSRVRCLVNFCPLFDVFALACQRWFGPSILLQLNFAFYIPSIPVLMISGQLEKFLDKRFGPIQV
jgi:hypothetical protein